MSSVSPAFAFSITGPGWGMPPLVDLQTDSLWTLLVGPRVWVRIACQQLLTTCYNGPHHIGGFERPLNMPTGIYVQGRRNETSLIVVLLTNARSFLMTPY